MPHINITTSSTGSNAGNCGQLVEYLGKKNRLKPEEKVELWFNQQQADLLPYELWKSKCGSTSIKFLNQSYLYNFTRTLSKRGSIVKF